MVKFTENIPKRINNTTIYIYKIVVDLTPKLIIFGSEFLFQKKRFTFPMKLKQNNNEKNEKSF